MTQLTLEAITVYPVKSLRGIDVQQWPMTPQGLQYDRHWMLVMPNGRFVSQRQLARMALIDTAIENESLILSADGHGDVRLPLLASGEQTSFSGTIWRDECDIVESQSDASAWLNQVLKAPKELRLVHMAEGFIRPQSQPERFGEHTFTAFADAAPYLVANQASLEVLNQTLTKKQLNPVDMRRFRPNLVISGLDAFAEHQMQTLQHPNGLSLKLCDHCERCVMTTIDPDSGVKDPDMEPYKTLVDLNPMPDNNKAAAFAVNAIVETPQNGIWSVGDSLSVS